MCFVIVSICVTNRICVNPCPWLNYKMDSMKHEGEQVEPNGDLKLDRIS
jgi:hypothetical protein